jgi:dipeptidyl-peptidase 4
MKKLILFISFLPLVLFGQGKKNITLEEIWQSPSFFGDNFWGLSTLSDGKTMLDLDYSDFKNPKIIKTDLVSGKFKGDVVDLQTLQKLLPAGAKISLDAFEISPDEKKLLIPADKEPIYRHSSKANYYIYDIASKKAEALSNKGKQSIPEFSPYGNYICFVRDNNLFLRNLTNNVETQITVDGEFNKIINGAVDWVYEEEFSFDKGFQWNEDGSKIAFYRFDESEVKEYNMQKWGSLYPSDYRFKYPKAGEKNSEVTLHIYDVITNVTKPVFTGDESDQYIPRMQWTRDPDVLCYTRLNRLQNHLELVLADGKAKNQGIKTTLLMSEKNNTYIEIYDHLYFLDDKKHFIWTSDADGYLHFYLYNLEGKMVRQITKGTWDITEFYGYDEKTGKLYYQSTELGAARENVYSINIDGSEKTLLSPEEKQGSSSAHFSSNFEHYVISFSNANTPARAVLYNAKTGKPVRTLVDNKELKETMKEYNLGKKEFATLKTSQGTELNYWILKPADFDPNKKYPVFMYVYGGPGANTVKDSWGGNDYFWHQMLAQKGYIVISVDNRGTGGRGKDFKHCTYKQLGKLETIDQIEAAKFFGSQPYIDKNRIGIFGWSYGGYMSSLCITLGADVFKMAIAVAPVTNWRYYDSIYTERYK